MKTFITTFILLISYSIFSQVTSEWRNIGRTGIYDQKGLLTEWPEEGPKLLWTSDSIPDGYSSPAIANNKIYLTGVVDSMDVMIALDMQGKIVWQKPYGRAWDSHFSPSRSTPTIEGTRIYVSSGLGDIACLDANTGDIIWKETASEKYGGLCGKFGISESLLLDEKNVFYTPGGNETTMIALDKATGKLRWKSKSLKDKTSYCSPLMIERNSKKQIVNVIDTYIFGISPENGEIKWKYDFKQYRVGHNNLTNTPLYDDGKLYVTCGYDHTSVQLKLAEDLSSASLNWKDTVLDNHFGGVVKIDNYIYGSNWINNRQGNWVCLDWETGKVQYETTWKGKGAIIAANGMLYCYEDKTGYIALVEANPEKFEVISKLKVPKGGQPWAHPVIYDGVLFVRNGVQVLAYDVKEH